MYRHAPVLYVLLISILLAPGQGVASNNPVDSLAEEYVKLVLCVGRHVPDYVDAYSGPEELKNDAAHEEVEKGFPYQRLSLEAERLLSRVQQANAQAASDSDRRRLSFLGSQLHSLRSVLDLHRGYKQSFDQEARAIYGVETPRHDSAYYESLLAGLDSLLPGTGDILTRYLEFRKLFVVPKPLIDTVVQFCLAECRARTGRYIVLPEGEDCRLELVGGRSWGGYNWYLGELQSLVQIDTTNESHLETLLEVVAHEAYPGHHLAAAVREKHLVKDSGWVEYSVSPLHCPTSVLDEGLATVAIDLVFPDEELVSFYKRSLFPLLKLDTALAGPCCRVVEARKRLLSVDLDVAREYLEGSFDSTRAINWLCRFSLLTPEGARQSLRFTEEYRTYQVTYTVGEVLVRDYLERHGGTPDNPAKRWGLFYSLLAEPRLPSDLD